MADEEGREITQENLEKELEYYFAEGDYKVKTGTSELGEPGFIITITENVKEGRDYFINQNGILENGDNTGESEPEQVKLTDVFVSKYTDGTLVFSSNEAQYPGKTLEKSYGNIKDNVFSMDMSTVNVDVPWIDLTNTEDIMKINKVIIADKIVPKNMAFWFFYLVNVQEIEGIENIDTRYVTDMSWLFFGCTSLTTLDVSHFDTSNVTNMFAMFSGIIGINSLDVSHFDTSNVTDMSQMFVGCEKLENLDVSGFDTKNVTNMTQMFAQTKLSNIDVSKFDTSNVTAMSRMFFGNANLTTIDLSNFNTSKVTDFSMMFNECSQLKTIDISNFDILPTANVSEMFDSFMKKEKTIYVKNEDTKNYLETNDGQEYLTYIVK